MDIATAIRARRAELGLTQEQLAERAGLRQGHLSQLETGSRKPTLPTLLKLRDALDLTTEQWNDWIDGAAA